MRVLNFNLRAAAFFQFPLILMFTGCDTNVIEQKHARLQQQTTAISIKFDERIALADKLEEIFARGRCAKEKTFVDHLSSLNKKLKAEKFDPAMTSRVSLRGTQDLQANLVSSMQILTYSAKDCFHGSALASLVALKEKIATNDQEVKTLYNEINASVQEYNILISVPPSSWANELFLHYSVMQPWSLSGE